MPRIIRGLSGSSPARTVRPSDHAVETVAAKDPSRRRIVRGETTAEATYNLDDFARRGECFIEDARREADAIIAKARQDAAEMLRQADARGYREGTERAEVDAAAKVQQQAAELSRRDGELLTSIADGLTEAGTAWSQQVAGVLSATIVAACDRICRQSLAIDPNLITRWAADAVEALGRRHVLAILVHPETLARVGSTLDRVAAGAESGHRIEVRCDETMGLHDVRVLSEGGGVSAGIEDQLRALQQRLEKYPPAEVDDAQSLDASDASPPPE